MRVKGRESFIKRAGEHREVSHKSTCQSACATAKAFQSYIVNALCIILTRTFSPTLVMTFYKIPFLHIGIRGSVAFSDLATPVRHPSGGHSHS